MSLLQFEHDKNILSKPDKADGYIDQARQWLKENTKLHGYNRWQSVNPIYIVAEYIANQNGDSLWDIPEEEDG